MRRSVPSRKGIKGLILSRCVRSAASPTCRLPIAPATLAMHRKKSTRMKIGIWIPLACLACLPLASHAQVNDAVRALKVLPAPKEARMAEGKIVIKPSTTILIGNSEDRTAAETLQKEIQDRTGMKLSIRSEEHTSELQSLRH